MLQRLFGMKDTNQASVEPAPSRPGASTLDSPVDQTDDRPRILGVVAAGKSALVTTTSELIVLNLATGTKRFDFAQMVGAVLGAGAITLAHLDAGRAPATHCSVRWIVVTNALTESILAITSIVPI